VGRDAHGRWIAPGVKDRLAVFALAMGLLLTGGTIPDKFVSAVAMRGCTQEDIPALELYLTSEAYSGAGLPATPYLRIEVAWDEWGKHEGRNLELIPLSRQGGHHRRPVVRAELDLAQAGPVWLAGRLHLEKVDIDRRVEGSYVFSAPDGRILTGSFRASWISRRVVCG
jgi:hypothetical protein